MVKTVGDLLIKLGVDGIEGVNALKGSLRQLSQATKFSDKDIEKLTTGIKNYSRVVGASEKTLRGQIAALRGVREQARIGGKAYNDLSRDIERYEKRLKSAGNTSEETGKKILSAAQILAQFPARKPSAFSTQINQLNKDLSDLKVNTDAYVLQLRKIQEREDSFRQAQARQSVIARAQTAAGPVVDPRAAITISTALPKTTAALSLRVSELRENLQNLDFTSNQYRDTQREILSIEKQLADATNQRTEAIKGVTEQQRRAEQLAERSRGRKQRLLANQASADAEYNAALGAHITAPVMPTRQLSNLYQSIGQVSAAGMAREVEMMGNSYRKVAADINVAARAGGNSIKSLQGQRVAFDSLRNVLDPTSREFRQVSGQIQTLDKRLGRLTRTTSRFSKANLLQGAGAVASSAIFGGPLGALGSLVGFGVGGPGGAALGGGLGASANILVDYGRQIAEINTQLNLSKQTLALASNGQEEYNTLLQVARNISSDYAVSLKETIGGFSQVAVAARANNLTFKETETIFRGLVSSGIAFGKSQQDIDAIVRATVQVLSKGKLSAEELQGQIGERLPGAVAKFAEATGRSLPQLAKDLKAGTVQISDFVDFSKKQLFDYDKVAKLIATGPEKAGARLKLALEESAENYGGFFQRVGAKFQDFGTNLLNFFNDNQETIQNFVIDSIIAFKNLALEVKLAFEDIKQSILFLKPVLDAFTTGIDVVGKANRRQRALQAAGFDDQKTREEVRESVGKYYSPIFQRNRFLEEFLREFNYRKGQAVRKGEQILREQTGDTVPGREALRKQYFGDYIPYALGQYTPDTKPGGTKPDGSPDPTGGVDADKDISNAVLDAKLNAMREVITLADVEAKLANDLLQISLQDLKANEEILAEAEAHNQAEQTRIQIEKQLRDLEANMIAQQNKALFTLGEITEEEYEQRELERLKAELQEQFLTSLMLEKYTREEIEDIIEKILESQKTVADESKSFAEQFGEGIKSMGDLTTNLANVSVNAFSSMGDKLAEFVTTGKANFKDFARSLLADLSKVFIKFAMFQAIGALVPGLGPFMGLASKGAVIGGTGGPPTTMPDSVSLMAANGMAFAKNKIVPYAKGGIVKKPTFFQYANGGSGNFGLMGEAGPEAIMPLRRGRNGKLGVESSGGVGNVVVNVDASGSSVQGSQPNAKALGNAIGAAVQAELVRQKRPGGLLS